VELLRGEGLALRYGVEPAGPRDAAPSCNAIDFDPGKVPVTLRQPGGEEEPLAGFSGQAVTTSEIYPEPERSCVRYDEAVVQG
jgi:hypothetical protein